MSKSGQYWLCECYDYDCVLGVSLPQRVISEVVKNKYNGLLTAVPHLCLKVRRLFANAKDTKFTSSPTSKPRHSSPQVGHQF